MKYILVLECESGRELFEGLEKVAGIGKDVIIHVPTVKVVSVEEVG